MPIVHAYTHSVDVYVYYYNTSKRCNEILLQSVSTPFHIANV